MLVTNTRSLSAGVGSWVWTARVLLAVARAPSGSFSVSRSVLWNFTHHRTMAAARSDRVVFLCRVLQLLARPSPSS